MVAFLALSGCSAGSKKPDEPKPGPLKLGVVEGPCVATDREAEVELDAGQASNRAKIPLTIDLVELRGAKNVQLLDSFLLPRDQGTEAVPAVDATVPAKGEPGAKQSLHLRVRLSEVGQPASIDGYSVSYHNVKGNFRAVSRSPVELVRRCRP